MTARIVLFGASGYTGGRTAEAMVGRGLRPVLAGRDAAGLAALAERLGGLPTAHADVADRTSIVELIGPGDVLVSTVGPFHRLGWPAVRSAVDVGAHYLDSNAEPPFVRGVYEVFGPDAVGTGAALLTAFGHDHVLGVLAGALALRSAGSAAQRVDVGYFVSGRGRWFSRGALRSVLGIALEPGYGFRGGALTTEPNGARRRSFDLPDGARAGVSVGASEQFALPRLAPQLGDVDVYLGGVRPDRGVRAAAAEGGDVGHARTFPVRARAAASPADRPGHGRERPGPDWFGLGAGVVHAAAPLVGRIGRVRGTRWAAGHLADLGTRRVPAAPDPAAVASVHVLAEVFDAGGTLLARTRLTAPEPYGLTAGLLAWGAGRAAERGVDGVGALDAVSAFGLEALQAGVTELGVRVEE